MPRTYYDTCFCIVDHNTQTLLESCRTHRTYADSLAHNRSFNLRATDKDKIDEDKRKEKLKPEFQRR